MHTSLLFLRSEHRLLAAIVRRPSGFAKSHLRRLPAQERQSKYDRVGPTFCSVDLRSRSFSLSCTHLPPTQHAHQAKSLARSFQDGRLASQPDPLESVPSPPRRLTASSFFFLLRGPNRSSNSDADLFPEQQDHINGRTVSAASAPRPRVQGRPRRERWDENPTELRGFVRNRARLDSRVVVSSCYRNQTTFDTYLVTRIQGEASVIVVVTARTATRLVAARASFVCESRRSD